MRIPHPSTWEAGAERFQGQGPSEPLCEILSKNQNKSNTGRIKERVRRKEGREVGTRGQTGGALAFPSSALGSLFPELRERPVATEMTGRGNGEKSC